MAPIGVHSSGTPNQGPEISDVRRAEERGAESFVDGGQEDERCGEIDKPGTCAQRRFDSALARRRTRE